MLLNEKFEMDNWTSKDYDKIIQKILRDDNPNLQGYVKNCPDIQQLNLPIEVQDLIVLDWIKEKKGHHDFLQAKYHNSMNIKQTIEFGDIDVEYVLAHPYTYKYLKKFFMKEFKETYNFLESLGNPFKLFRFIHLNYSQWRRKINIKPDQLFNFILNNKNIHLGICWTPLMDAAEEFGWNELNLDDNSIIVEAKVERDVINLPKTLQKRSEFTYYHYENEIELIKGSKIFVENIYRYNILKNKWIKYTVNNYYKV